jgi:hypothetical protein
MALLLFVGVPVSPARCFPGPFPDTIRSAFEHCMLRATLCHLRHLLWTTHRGLSCVSTDTIGLVRVSACRILAALAARFAQCHGIEPAAPDARSPIPL